MEVGVVVCESIKSHVLVVWRPTYRAPLRNAGKFPPWPAFHVPLEPFRIVTLITPFSDVPPREN